MSSRHLVDPALAAMIELIPPFATDREGLAASRALFAEIPLAELREGMTRTELSLPGAEGGPAVRALLYRPADAALDRAILHFHGGGFVMGRPEMSDLRNIDLAARHGCAILAVAYRLAPENPYPAALDDAFAAWRWLAAELGEGGGVVLLGESAGAGLAASLAHLLRDLGEPPPLLQALLYPMLDPRSGEEGFAAAHLGEFVWTRANNRFAWGAYLGDADAASAAPGQAASFAGLPPTFLVAGALDLFLEEDLAYAGRLAAAAVPLELHVLPGAYHGFDVMGPSAPAEALGWLLARALKAAVTAPAPELAA